MMEFIEKWTINLNFPFDWNLKLKFAILPERPTPCIVKGKKWLCAIRINGKMIPVIVEKPKLLVLTPHLSLNLKRRIKKSS